MLISFTNYLTAIYLFLILYYKNYIVDLKNFMTIPILHNYNQ